MALHTSGHFVTGRRALVLGCFPQLLVAADFSIVAVVLPSIRDSFGVPASTAQWMVGAYNLSFAAFLLVSGRAADRFGRVRMLRSGLSVFGVASVATALAASVSTVVIARAVQGIGAAMMVPAAIALLTGAFVHPEERRRALAAYGIVVSAGFVAGALGAGAVASVANWRWVVAIEAALAITALAALHRAKAPHSATSSPIDPVGALLAAMAIGVLALTVNSASVGARPAIIGGQFAVCLLLSMSFLAVDHRCRAPLAPKRLVMQREVAAACAAGLLITGTGVGSSLVLTLFLQESRGQSPIETGLAFSAFGVAALTLGLAAGRAVERLGPGPMLCTGLLVQGASFLGFSFLPAAAPLVLVMLGISLFGAGHVIGNVSIVIAATSRVPTRDHGAVAGILTTFQYIGGALGAATLVAVAEARSSATGDLVAGFHRAVLTGGLAAVLGALLVAAVLRRQFTRAVPV